jgi:hypothetical protein
MAESEYDWQVIVSREGARGGAIGHRVVYVLAFGLAATLIAFLAIGLYFGHGAVTQTISTIFATRGMLGQRLVFYGVLLALAVVATMLLLSLWNMVLGRSTSTSQTVMRWRVVLQFIAICLTVAIASSAWEWWSSYISTR